MTPYAWFMASLACWFGAAAMQQVLFSWLVIGELRVGAEWVGTAQMCASLPALLFALVGGAAADRADRRRLLMRLHVFAALAAIALASVVAAGRLRLGVLLGYALCWGTIVVFAQPARDSLLAEVAGADMMRAVTATTLLQFLATALGAGLAGLAGQVGSAPALSVVSGLAVAGLVPLGRLPRAAGAAIPTPGSTRAAIAAGVREVWHSPRLRPLALLVGANGLLFMGPWIVLCPLIVRDHYRGGIDDLSMVMMALPLGTITTSAGLLLRGGIARKGQAFLLALLGVALCLVGFAARPPFWAFVALAFAWGMFHAVFFNTSRTLFQLAAPDSHRARVMSVHALAFLGMAPISNLVFGFAATAMGPTPACALAGIIMIGIVTRVWWFSSVRYLT